jgi:hypothetical protein
VAVPLPDADAGDEAAEGADLAVSETAE